MSWFGNVFASCSSVKAGQTIEVVAGDKSFSAKILKKQIGPAGSGHLVEYEDGRLTFLIVDQEQKKELVKLVTGKPLVL